MPSLPFNVLQELDLPLPEIVAGRIGYFHDAFTTFAYEVCDTLPEGDRDLVVLAGGRNRSAAVRELGRYPGRVVAMLAPDDASIRPANLGGAPGLPPNLVALFAINNELADRRAVSVPLGVRPNNLRPLRFVRQNHRREERKLLLGNFGLRDEYYPPDRTGTPHIRRRLVDQLRGESWASVDIARHHRDGAEEMLRYYSQIASHRFVLSPEGNGIDCYRTWEALYLGAVPIVMVSSSMSAFRDLPILFTEDYSELSEDYLERRWEEMSSASFEIDRILTSYYLQRFLAAVGQLRDPHFLCWKLNSPKFHDVLRRSSRSAAEIVAETPTPPFVDCRDLMAPDGWNTPGRMSLERTPDGLRVVADGDGPAVVEIPLRTIAGASFCLTADIRHDSRDPGALTFNIEQRPETIAAIEVTQESEMPLKLDFVARSERTVLSIRAPETVSQASWLFSDLSLRADL